ncbi:hypothetical protein KCTC52924_03070 [Arenibacter antarcticus]
MCLDPNHKLKIDLFSMVHNRSGLYQRLIREPVIDDISMYSEVPLLVLSGKVTIKTIHNHQNKNNDRFNNK